MDAWNEAVARRQRRSDSARKAGRVRAARLQGQRDATRNAEAHERFREQLESARRFSAIGGSSIGMPPDGYRAFAVNEVDIFGGKWFGVFRGTDVGPFQTKIEIERAAEAHAFARGHGRGHVGGKQRRGGKGRHGARGAGLIAAATALRAAMKG